MGWKQYLKGLGYNPDVPIKAQIEEWYGWYTATNGWYSSTEVSSTDRRTYKVERLSIKPARMVCQEWASLLLNERTLIATDNDGANTWLDAWLDSSRFLMTGQRLVERSFALGTGAWALRVESLAQDSAFSPGARIVPQRFDARQVIPLTYDEDTCTECAFRSSVTRLGKRFEQLQIHRLIGGRYVVETALFDGRGRRVEIEGIATEFVTTSDTPLFALVRPSLENTYWDYGPFGVSVFDDALGAVKLVDTAIDNTFRDIWLGQKMLFLDERLLETDSSGNITVPRQKDQQLFRKAELDSGAGSLIEDYNPDLRVTDNRLALRTALDVLGFRAGLGSDYFAIEGAGAVKTATEVVAEKSDLFRNVRKHENGLEPAIRTIIAGVLSLARTVVGVSLPEVLDITVKFDDSVIEDTAAERARDLGEVGAGLMQPWEYRVKWYGEDEKTARAMIETEGLPAEEF